MGAGPHERTPDRTAKARGGDPGGDRPGSDSEALSWDLFSGVSRAGTASSWGNNIPPTMSTDLASIASQATRPARSQSSGSVRQIALSATGTP